MIRADSLSDNDFDDDFDDDDDHEPVCFWVWTRLDAGPWCRTSVYGERGDCEDAAGEALAFLMSADADRPAEDGEARFIPWLAADALDALDENGTVSADFVVVEGDEPPPPGSRA